MMKRNKLYTVTRFNRGMFNPIQEKLFPNGGALLAADRLASEQFGANYGDAGNTLSDYMDSTNAFGISKADNPFSKMNLKGGLGAMASTPIGGGLLNAGAGAIGGLANSALSGGLSSGAGSAISNIGSTIGGAVGAVNPLLGAAVTMGSGIISGGVNALFGSAVDEEKLNAAKEGTSAYNSFVSNASSFDDIQGPTAQANVQDAYRGGVFTSGSAKRKNEELKRQRLAARQFADRSILNNVNNLAADQINNALANFSAFGGPIDTSMDGAIGYGFMADYLSTKKKNIENKNQMTNMFMGTPSTMFDFGGDLQVHGGDYPTGLTHINAGGTHEENPNDGVQMGVDQQGTPNLVEEGETVYNDYVFSNRILADEATKQLFHLPKKRDITFADISKRLEKEISERPNDPISQAGFQAQMQTLENQQERQKQEMEAERAKAAFEALSPEEQAALMQQKAQQEAIAQEAAMQEVPENNGENTIEMQADGSEAVVGQEPPMMAEGGHLYAEGSKIRKGVYKALGFHTDKEFLDWARKHKLAGDDKWSEKYGMLEGLANDDEAWKSVISHPTFIEAIKDNLALAHAIANNYDFGVYQPSSTDKATIQSISKGNWKATDGTGWFGSDDLAFKQATKGLTDDQIKALTTEQLADRMKTTDAYKNTSKWLENPDNALLYLNTLLNDSNTPEVAKNHALQYVKNGKWKDGYTYNYNDVFGKVRATNPGTYWHTVMEANRGNQAKNFVIGENGQVDEIIGDVPANWTSAGNYSWATPENDVTYNYYRRPATAAPVSPETSAAKVPEEEEPGIKPAKKADWMRYAGLFGPAVGLGMQMAGIGRPDYSDLNATVSNAGNAHLATYKPLGNYLTYRPMDIWFEQNRMDANARATDRAIMNSASPSRMAGLIANGYNSQLVSGDLYRKALEYNDAKRKDVAEFNRGTDQFNAEAFNRLSQFNASALNDAASRSTNARLHAAQQKLDNNAGWYNSLYGNVSGLFKGISDLGRENAMFNVLAKQVADGVYGNTGDSYTGSIYTKRQKKKSNGGRVNKKKGLTY